MRALTLGVVAVLALATTASAAQPDFEGMHATRMLRLNALGVPGRPYAQMSKETQEWIAAETQRQATAPKSLSDLALTVDKSLHGDLVQTARTHEWDTHDIILAIILQITRDVESSAAETLKAAQATTDTAAIQAAAEKLALATSLRKQALEVQTDASLAMMRF